MEFIKDIPDDACFSRQDIEKFIVLLSPFAPHFAEELWCEVLNHAETVFNDRWPEFENKFIFEETITIPVQVNGKLRGTLIVGKDEDSESILKSALELESVSRFVSGRHIVKQIYVPGKIVNIVTKQ